MSFWGFWFIFLASEYPQAALYMTLKTSALSGYLPEKLYKSFTSAIIRLCSQRIILAQLQFMV